MKINFKGNGMARKSSSEDGMQRREKENAVNIFSFVSHGLLFRFSFFFCNFVMNINMYKFDNKKKRLRELERI